MNKNINYREFLEDVPLPITYCKIIKNDINIIYKVEYINEAMVKILNLDQEIYNEDILELLPVFKEDRYYKELFDDECKTIKRYIPRINDWMYIKKQFIGEEYILLYFDFLMYDYRKLIDESNRLEEKFYIKDKDGLYLDCSRNMLKILNKEQDELFGKTDLEIWGKRNADTIKQFREKALSNKEVRGRVMIEDDEKTFSIRTYFIYDKDEFIGEIGTINSIVRKNTNKKYNTKDFIRAIENHMPDNIFFKDINMKIIGFNSSFLELTRIGRDELIGRDASEIPVFKQFYKKVHEIDNDIIQNKRERIYDLELEIDNQKIIIEIIKIPFLDNCGNVMGIAGVARDVSKRTIKETGIEKLRLDYFVNLSHELKTPINLIISSLQIIEKREKELLKENITLNKNVKIIKQNGNRILKLVENIINLTKLESGHTSLKLQNEDIVYFIEEICMSVTQFANQNNIKLVFDTQIEEFVMAFDTESIERVLLNLLSNAIKYNKANGKIYVDLSKNDKNFIIKVADDGIGIPTEKLDKIFDRFEQVNDKMASRVKGTGIGLSLVKSLVELHGGNIRVNSILGVGSEFIVEIPITLNENEDSYINSKIINDIGMKMEIEFSDI